MNRQAAEKYVRILEIAKTDWQYRALVEQYSEMDESVRELLTRLSEEDCETVMEYIGLIGAVGTRLLEISCDHMELKD